MTTSTLSLSTAIDSADKAAFISWENMTISVLIPSYNEEVGIGKVIEGFRQALPSAEIFVYDNNSSDRTIEKAKNMGAVVRQESRQGTSVSAASLNHDWSHEHVPRPRMGGEPRQACQEASRESFLGGSLVSRSHLPSPMFCGQRAMQPGRTCW